MPRERQLVREQETKKKSGRPISAESDPNRVPATGLADAPGRLLSTEYRALRASVSSFLDLCYDS